MSACERVMSARKWVASVGDNRFSERYSSCRDWLERNPAANNAIGLPDSEQLSRWRQRRQFEDRSARDKGARAVSGIIALNTATR